MQNLNYKRKYRIELAKTLTGHWYSVWEQGKKKEKFLGNFVSATTILNAYPTSEHLVRWIAENGFNESRAIRDAAGKRGTKIHLAIEGLLAGGVLQEGDHTLEEWVKLKSFVDWYNEYKPEIIATELAVFSKKERYAGRVDCIAKLFGEIYVIDWKSSKSIHESFPLQFSAYAKAIEEMTNLNINNTACLQLGASNKNGYRFVVYPDWRDHYKVFENVRAVWQYEYFDSKKNPKEPPVLELPLTLKLKKS